MMIEVNPTIKDMRDLLCTAIEGGISYWCNDECENVDIKRSEGWGGADFEKWWYVKLSLDTACMSEDDTLKHFEVTPEIMLEKFDAWMDYCKETMKWRWDQWVDALTEDDLGGSCDAEDADCFVQYCLFGEVVFG